MNQELRIKNRSVAKAMERRRQESRIKHRKLYSLFLPLNSRAFTLVEILVVMTILSVFGTLIVIIFSRTLTGSNKSQIIGVIKQNGQSVLEIIDKTIRNADKVICVSLDKNNLITVKEGIYTRFRFIPPAPVSGPTMNGFIQQDNPVRGIDPNTGQNETDPVFENRICANGDAMNSPIIITDTNTQSGVSVSSTNPIFEKVSAAGFMDQVTIKFDLRPGLNASKAVAGQIDPVTFQTTIQLR